LNLSVLFVYCVKKTFWFIILCMCNMDRHVETAKVNLRLNHFVLKVKTLNDIALLNKSSQSYYCISSETIYTSILFPLLCTFQHSCIGAGTIFRLGEQKLNDFTVGKAKIGEKQSRQSNPKYNFMEYVFFEKGICNVQWDLRQSPEAGEFLRIFIFCVRKSNFTFCKVTFN